MICTGHAYKRRAYSQQETGKQMRPASELYLYSVEFRELVFSETQLTPVGARLDA